MSRAGTADVAALPATAKDAELAAIRLGAGGFAAAVAQAAELLVRGELEPSHPWPAALVWRRVQDLHGVEMLVSDGVLAPLLDATGAAEVLRAVASRDPSGRLASLADALEPDPSDEMRPAGGLTRNQLIAKYAGSTVREAARGRRERALPRRGEEWAYECPSGHHAWLGLRGLDDERCPYCGSQPVRWQRPPELPRLSRRRLQRRRQRVALYESRMDGTAAPPAGRGRRPGARNRARVQRLADLRARYQALPYESEPWELLLASGADREFVAEHAKRWRLSPHEARADWLDVQRELVDTGCCGYRTPLVQAQLSGDATRVRHERKRLARLRKKVDLQHL